MKLLDTNVFIYAAGRPHTYRDCCIRLLGQSARTVDSFAIDSELLQEILYVYDLRGERGRGIQAVKDILLLFPNPLPIGKAEVMAARTLMISYSWLKPRDAIHAAVAVVHDMEGVISADKGLDGMAEVTRIDPLVY